MMIRYGIIFNINYQKNKINNIYQDTIIMTNVWQTRKHLMETCSHENIYTFSRTDTKLIFSVRGVPGVNRYVENLMYKDGIRTALDLLDIYYQYVSFYGNNKKCAYFVGRYLDRIGVMEPRRSIITDSLRARVREICINNMMIKPHVVIDKYF